MLFIMGSGFDVELEVRLYLYDVTMVCLSFPGIDLKKT